VSVLRQVKKCQRKSSGCSRRIRQQ